MAVYDNADAYKHLPVVNFNFMLRVEGVWDLPCKSVHSFTKENEFEPIQEGGLNDYVHLRRKPISKPFTFTVERYAMVDELAYDPLQLGAELVLPLLLFVADAPGKFGKTRRAYSFTGCTIMSKEYGELDGEKSGLLIERTQIAYRELVVVSVPFEQTIDLWKWDGTGKSSARRPDESTSSNENSVRIWKPDGTGTSSAKADGSTSLSNKNKRKWEFDTTQTHRYQGAGIQSARADVSTPLNKDDIRRWEFDTSETYDYKGKGTQSARPDVSTPIAEKDIRKWEFDSSPSHDYLGKGTLSAKTDSPRPYSPRKR